MTAAGVIIRALGITGTTPHLTTGSTTMLAHTMTMTTPSMCRCFGKLTRPEGRRALAQESQIRGAGAVRHSRKQRPSKEGLRDARSS
jgi:hypothetical protein